ncbi:MAG: hypothetical protein DCC75_07670, partial [Proteobacteria bacterium]
MESTVRDILKEKGSQDVVVISPSRTVFEAIALMAKHNIGALPVVDKDEIVGIISERDYARRIILENRSSKATKVSEIMDSKVFYATLQDNCRDLMSLMTENRVRHLPVLKGEKIIGLVSMGDVVKSIISDQEFLLGEMTRFITGS